MASSWLFRLLCCLFAVTASTTAADVADTCGQPNATRIILWSIMRSGSSALSRSFLQRSDTKVLFEPFVSVYYLGPEREHPRHTDLPADPQYTYKKMWDQLLNPPGGESVSFAKDFAVTLPRRWWRSKEMAEVKHSFLIRHPEPAMTSMLRACKDPESTGYSYFNETEMGYSELVAMFEYVTKELHQVPPVIDHDDLMKQPEAVLRSFLGHLGLDFDERMLHWTEPLPPHPEIWAGFFENANRSTGFKPTRVERKSTEAPAEIADAIARAMPAYSLLASHRLQM
ncbi:unnamed protein product [Symbiodinium sp. KB8]|nr:unnamed protein product [Symbiodinium sp. KB8]